MKELSGSSVEREMDYVNTNSTTPMTDKKDVMSNCESQESPNTKKNTSKRIMIMCIVLAVGGITCCIVGVVYFEKAKQLSASSESSHKPKTGPDTGETGKPKNDQTCSLSQEVQSSGLIKFFNKVEEAYFQLHPHDIPYKFGLTRKDLEYYHGYNPNPAAIKAITDKAKSLLEELRKLQIRKELLKLREAETLTGAEHFLEQNFGSPYDYGYYTGEWMLGPSRFCYMQPISKIQFSFQAYLDRLEPRTVQDMESIIKVLKDTGIGINQYQKNLEMGIKVGMVNSIEECVVGYDCLVEKFPRIGASHSAADILKEPSASRLIHADFHEIWFVNVTQAWHKKYGKTLMNSLIHALIENLGEPIAQLFKYLSGEYRSHCVPSNVSSGLATRPVSYVYTNGVANLSMPTTKTLPTGEKVNGKKAYERIIRFFTTTNATPDEVHELGWKVLRSLYPQVVEIAKKVTNEKDEDQAVISFRKYINSSDMFFNKKPFPANESDERAYWNCRNISGAKKYCPVRYKTLQEWFTYSQSTLSMLRPRILHMFHWLVGPKKTTPVCPVIMQANFQPTSASQSYQASGPYCRFPGRYFVPFFLDRMGPIYSEWSVNAHEALPGHHLQSQGRFENFFRGNCDPLLGSLLRSRHSNEAFTEGWALYAEDPLIAKDTNTYDGEPLQKYGMLKWQIWRALRLIVDTGVHYKGMTRDEALQLFSTYAWDDSDVAQKEMTRYQSGPGQATAYMIGQRAIISMRNKATQKLGSKFNLRDFHYYILSRSPAPLKFVQHLVDRYIDCELDNQRPGCKYILVNETKPWTFVAKKLDSVLYDETLNPPDIREL